MMPVPSRRVQRIIARYATGQTLREVAAAFGVSLQYVHQLVGKHAPGIMRAPHIVPARRRRKAA